jgi:membrane associated rhomboid family serine protease
MDIINDIKRTFKEGSVLTRLIYINIGVFLLVKILGVFFYLAGQPFVLVEWLSLPSNTSDLLARPWTIITYMFIHAGFIHLLFNILGLYWFGKLFLYHFEGNKLLSVYLLGGIAAGLLYILAFNLFPIFSSSNAILMGASGSIFAVLVAAAFYDPQREIMMPLIGTFSLKYVAAFYVLLSVIGISTSNPGGNIAHVGGAFWGWFYIFQLGKGKDMGAGFVKFLNNLGKNIEGLFKPKNNLKVTFKQPPRDDYEYNRQKKNQQEEMNRILDKIAKSGYDSLSKSEKEILFKQGKK